MQIRATVRRKTRIPKVIKALDRARIKILFGQAGYLRKVARNSIRTARKTKKKRGQSSRPGETPFSHRGAAGIKRTLSFHVDRVRGFALVGFESGGKQPAIARAIEQGGTTRVKYFGDTYTRRMAARPVLGPALRKTYTKLREIARDEYRKALR